MAKQANRMMIGGFVVLAVILMAASLVIFGSGKFFKKTVKCVLFFDESVKGLSVGSPVLFQGVQIGSVTSIVLQVDSAQLQAQIPVFIEFEPEKFTVRDEGREALRDPRKNIPLLIERGLRAQLVMQSFITGQLSIEIDFRPGTPVVLKNMDKDYIEIPTIPSTGARLAKTLDRLDLDGLKISLESALEGLVSTLAGIERFINNPDLAASIRSLKDTLQNAHKFISKVDRQVDPMADGVKKTVKDFGKLARNADAKLEPLKTNLDKTLSAARGVISPDAPIMVELENSLQEIAAMSRSLRRLADSLEEQPEILLRGKKSPGKERPGGK